MPINQLIANGVTPFGANLPDIANMLESKRQQNFLNGISTDQNARVKAKYESDQEESTAKQVLAETQWASKQPSKIRAISTLPHIMDALKKQGIDINTLDESHAQALLNDWQARAASRLGQGPPQTKYEAVGNRVIGIPGDGSAPSVAIDAPPVQETYGPPIPIVINGRPVVVQPGKHGGVKPIPDASPYDKPKSPGSGGGGGSAASNLTEEEYAALFGPQGAVPTGKLDPNRINSRTAKILARAFVLNPNQDMNKLASDASLMRNAPFMNRALTAETLPDIMSTMVEAGKKVGFSDYRIVGRMQEAIKGELNDPALAEYMTVRNDALMNIASTMRGVGMSDKAHEAEIEAANPTMSPQALDAWMRGQMTALKPRLERLGRYTRPGGQLPSNPAPVASPGIPASASPNTSSPIRVNTPAEAMALPPGTHFITPDGRVKVR